MMQNDASVFHHAMGRSVRLAFFAECVYRICAIKVKEQYAGADMRIKSLEYPALPKELIRAMPCDPVLSKTVQDARQAFHHIIAGTDSRLAVIVGPCSIHDEKAALEYAQRLSQLRQRYGHCLELIMRVYFEKPRTNIGWKGFVNDPDLNGTPNLSQGLWRARHLLCDITRLAVPAAVEFLNVFMPQYIADLVAWGAIGARTSESQIHRELASSLSCPIGFKNSIQGDIKAAIDAVVAARHPHHFLTIDESGRIAVAATTGNPDSHIILRGGKTPNFDQNHVRAAIKNLNEAGLPAKLMIDASHANSLKNPDNQPFVIEAIADQVEQGCTEIIGVMIESHLVYGRQNLHSNKTLVYGQSITDGCIDWATTVRLIRRLAQAVEVRSAKRLYPDLTPAIGLDEE